VSDEKGPPLNRFSVDLNNAEEIRKELKERLDELHGQISRVIAKVEVDDVPRSSTRERTCSTWRSKSPAGWRPRSETSELSSTRLTLTTGPGAPKGRRGRAER